MNLEFVNLKLLNIFKKTFKQIKSNHSVKFLIIIILENSKIRAKALKEEIKI